MDMNEFRGVMTIIWLVIFSGVVWWAYSPRRKTRFEEASRLVFDEPAANEKPARVLSVDDRER